MFHIHARIKSLSKNCAAQVARILSINTRAKSSFAVICQVTQISLSNTVSDVLFCRDTLIILVCRELATKTPSSKYQNTQPNAICFFPASIEKSLIHFANF